MGQLAVGGTWQSVGKYIDLLRKVVCCGWCIIGLDRLITLYKHGWLALEDNNKTRKRDVERLTQNCTAPLHVMVRVRSLFHCTMTRLYHQHYTALLRALYRQLGLKAMHVLHVHQQ